MAKRGAKLKVIDWDTVDKMCAIHCTGEEIAGILDVDYDTLHTACKREKKKQFSDYIKQKSANGKMSLRRRQYSAAMDGNATMLVWLGKNWLGQTDKAEGEDEHGGSGNVNLSFIVKDAKHEVVITKGE